MLVFCPGVAEDLLLHKLMKTCFVVWALLFAVYGIICRGHVALFLLSSGHSEK